MGDSTEPAVDDFKIELPGYEAVEVDWKACAQEPLTVRVTSGGETRYMTFRKIETVWDKFFKLEPGTIVEVAYNVDLPVLGYVSHYNDARGVASFIGDVAVGGYDYGVTEKNLVSFKVLKPIEEEEKE